MTPSIHRRVLLRSGVAATLACALPAARACEFFTTHLRIMHPWARATAKGATSAIVCMKFDEVSAVDRLIGVETPVAAGAEMGGIGIRSAVDLVIPSGRETLLGESGRVLRLVGLTQPLMLGRTYPLRLNFEHGGIVDADLSIDYTRYG